MKSIFSLAALVAAALSGPLLAQIERPSTTAQPPTTPPTTPPPRQPGTAQPTPTTPLPPATTTQPTPTTPPGTLLPPPGTLQDPALGAGEVKKPTTSEAVDKQFDRAVADTADFAADARNYIKGPVVTLEEALRITLARQPSIQLAQEDLEIARAGLQEAIGAFDTHLIADLTHGRTITPSPDGNILGQKKARKALIDLYRGVRDFRKGKNDGKIELEDIDDSTGNVKGTNTVDISGFARNGVDVSGFRRSPVSAADIELLRQLQVQASIIDQLAGTAQSAQINQDLLNQISGVEKTTQQAIARLERDLKKAISRFSIQETSKSNVTKYEVGLTKTFRSGITVNPKISFDKGGITNNVKAELEVTVPLGQGFGGNMLRAIEDSSYYDLLASELSLRHKVSDALLQTALAYWNCIAALENYVMLRQSEDISDSMVELTDLRLKSEEVAASEVSKAKARNFRVVGQVIDAEFALLDARRQLAIAMGLENEELHNPPFAAGGIPTDIPLGDLSASITEMAAKSLASRADRAAALQLVRSGKILAEAAWREIKPRFDFFFRAGLASAHDGAELYELFSVYNDRWRGMSATGGFSFDWDIVNNPAKGAYVRSLAEFNQSRITARDIDRNIVNNVLLSASEIRKRKEQLGAVTEAARASRDVLSSERMRYNDGEGSLIDTLLVEEQYTDDLISVITVKLQFISAVSRLRFESGTLLDPLSGHTPQTVTFSAENLSTVPSFDDLAVPAPLPTIETDARKRPLPLFQKFGRGNTAEVKAHESAIKQYNWRRSMLDQPYLNPTAVTGAPITVSDQSGKTVVVAPAPAAVVVPPPGPVAVEVPAAPVERVESVETVERAPSPAIPPATTAPPVKERPKPLLKRLFGN